MLTTRLCCLLTTTGHCFSAEPQLTQTKPNYLHSKRCKVDSSLPRKGRELSQQDRWTSGCLLAPFPALERALSCPEDTTSEGGLIAFPCPQDISELLKTHKTSHSLFLYPTCPCTMDMGQRGDCNYKSDKHHIPHAFIRG